MAAAGPGTSGGLPLRPAMNTGRESDDAVSPRGTPKVVSIAEPENISPLIQPLDGQPRKQFTAGVARRLSGRPAPSSASSRASIVSQKSMEDLPEPVLSTGPNEGQAHAHRQRHQHRHEKLLAQVAEWLQAEKAKLVSRKPKKYQASTAILPDISSDITARRSSQGSDSSALSLEKLQRILEESMADYGMDPTLSPNLAPRRTLARRRSSVKSLVRRASSDTDYQDGDIIVPSCDVVLDNSKTLGFSSGGASSSDLNIVATGKRAEKERRAWSTFKSEILRLAHTLRLKSWRRIPLENGDDIDVERLSGALTNAVYVVSPPADLPPPNARAGSDNPPKRRPPKLLLRIYGPQVEHLIDREKELGILRRLARKSIGPRLLGTFRNGRFEEYFDSTTLTPADLRVPETSKQIAKRMRELHDGIELLEQERQEGPFVWHNWNKWVERCEHVIKYLDDQIISGKAGSGKSKLEAWKDRGLVCGVEWPVFRGVIEKYWKFLTEYYGSTARIKDQLVFCHNDTQYGNILRLKPSGESPLLLPANTHKQLVVIDFEYASANTPGLEFANHFTEWCYNYHDPVAPYACNTQYYPTEEEQRRFIKSYVDHRPQFNLRTSVTPKTTPPSGPGSSISEFLLDSRTPSSVTLSTQCNYAEEEAQREKYTNQRIKELMKETRLWRVANSAQWVAWGIVQARVPGLDDRQVYSSLDEPSLSHTLTMPPSKMNLPMQSPTPTELFVRTEIREARLDHDHKDVSVGSATQALLSEQMDIDKDEDEEFDYLGYAQERAMFFWGDVVTLGLVKKEELPEGLRRRLKVVPY